MADLDPLTRFSKLGLFCSPSPQAPQNSIADPDPVGVILLGRIATGPKELFRAQTGWNVSKCEFCHLLSKKQKNE